MWLEHQTERREQLQVGVLGCAGLDGTQLSCDFLASLAKASLPRFGGAVPCGALTRAHHTVVTPLLHRCYTADVVVKLAF